MGTEEQEGLFRALCLGPMVLSLARRQLREIHDDLFLDPDQVEFLLTALVRYLEAVDGITPRRIPRTP